MRTTPDKPALHGQGSPQAYEETLKNLKAGLKDHSKKSCQDRYEMLGMLIHMVEDVNSHRGIGNDAHGVIEPDKAGSRNVDTRRDDAVQNTKKLIGDIYNDMSTLLQWCCCSNPPPFLAVVAVRFIHWIVPGLELVGGHLHGMVVDADEFDPGDEEWDHASYMGDHGGKKLLGPK